MKAVNPATAELIRDYPEHSGDEIQERLRRADSAFASWRTTPLADRASGMRDLGMLGKYTTFSGATGINDLGQVVGISALMKEIDTGGEWPEVTSRRNSSRVRGSSRKLPRIAEVIVFEFCFCTPRIIMQRW